MLELTHEASEASLGANRAVSAIRKKRRKEQLELAWDCDARKGQLAFAAFVHERPRGQDPVDIRGVQGVAEHQRTLRVQMRTPRVAPVALREVVDVDPADAQHACVDGSDARMFHVELVETDLDLQAEHLIGDQPMPAAQGVGRGCRIRRRLLSRDVLRAVLRATAAQVRAATGRFRSAR